MADMMDYLTWRGDILFSQVGLNDVDAMIFSALAYIRYDGIISEDLQASASLRTVAKIILAMPEPQRHCRVEKDLALLQAVADSERFGRVKVTFYRSVFVPEEETQFAAVTFLLEDGSAVLSFRGTDSTLVGWKEDFNMSFQKSVPAQRLAQEYTQRFAAFNPRPIRLSGHSKGGNLAVYAGAKCGEQVQDRILEVYNFDGPGFAAEMMTDPGYVRIQPKVRTLVPQFSVFGMLLEREDNQQVVLSNASGLMQHELYSWQVSGKNFVPVQEVTEGSRFLDRTLTTWLEGLTNEERSEFFDSVFSLLMQENANYAKDVLRPQNILATLRSISLEDGKRRMIGSVLQELLDSAKAVHNSTQV